MSVQAIRPGYHGDMKDTVDHFHGQQLLALCWDQHLLYATPMCIPVPPQMPFGALLSQVMPQLYGQHPQFRDIDWSTVHWTRGDQPFVPDPQASLADNGIDHKAFLRFRTPGLDGLAHAGI